MTAVRATVDLRAEHGRWVDLGHGVRVWVTDKEITRAIRNSRSTDTPSRRATAARNIAIGKKVGAYEAEG